MFNRATRELKGAIELRGVWSYLAITDLSARYRNTLLGPIWNSAYLVGQALALAVVFGAIFQSPMTKMMPYILSGMTAWLLGPAAIIDMSGLLVSMAGTIRSQSMPYLVYPLRAAMRNVLLFGHNVVAFLIIVPFFGHVPWINPIFLVGAVVLALISVPYGMLIAMLCARFRDIGQMVLNFAPILFFMTPVFWDAQNIKGPRQVLVHYNPFYYMVNLVRKPMLGAWPDVVDWTICGSILVGGWLLMLLALNYLKPKIPHWV
ncbi:MAG: ABC transporter permease [Caulobacter sp.]|jgi:ABC-type polysaccharide/polyol phosphate export permease|nr:ABC transporter permease [Caulobacter sp.]MBW8892415.1 ABC transporter permease [Burkholderiales bacterium]